MRLTAVAKQFGILPDQIRWLEKKGYIEPGWILLKRRRVRDYPEDEVRKIGRIVKYRRRGFEHDVAYQKAMEELSNPRLVQPSSSGLEVNK